MINVEPGEVLIPDFIDNSQVMNVKKELIPLIINMLEDKNEDDLRNVVKCFE